MSDVNVHYSRGTLTVDGKPYAVKKLGKGMFTVAYVTTDTRKPRVFLLTQEDDSGDYSKSALYELNRDGEANSFLPKVKRVGWTHNATVYEMPLYDAPLRKANSPKAWAQYLVLKRCWERAEDDLRKRLGWKQASSPYVGHEQMSMVVECARKDKAITRALLTSLETLRDYMANYGSEYSFEFSPRNLATDARGRLVLLDVTFSRLSVQRQRAAARKKHRGW